MTALATPRLRLAPFAAADADELVQLFRDPAVRRYLLDDALVGPEWMAGEIAASEARFAREGTGMWSLRLADGDGTIIGFTGFRPFFGPPQLQLLYGLLPSCWGRGFATEAAARLCRHGFEVLGLDPIRAAIDVPNTASAAVLSRLGFARVNTEHAGPTAFFALTRAAWAERAGLSG